MSNEKLEELYYKYYHLVKDTAFKVLHDHEFTEDVCHDVFLKLSDEWMEADLTPRQRENYLRVAAHRKAIDYYNLRKQSGENVPYEEAAIDEVYAIVEDWDEPMLQRDFISRILRDLKEYKEHWYIAVLRYEYYHEPVELIARELGVSTSAIRVWHLRGKMWIRKHYKKAFEKLK